MYHRFSAIASRFSKIFQFFYQPPPPGFSPAGGETLLNVASIFPLSNRIQKIFRLFHLGEMKVTRRTDRGGVLPQPTGGEAVDETAVGQPGGRVAPAGV